MGNDADYWAMAPVMGWVALCIVAFIFDLVSNLF